MYWPEGKAARLGGKTLNDDSDDDDDDDFYDEKYNAYKGIADEDQNEVPDAAALEPKIDCALEGIFPYPNDCSKFYVCIENSDEIDVDATWSVIQYECPSEMVFNSKNETCDFPKDIVPPRECPSAYSININNGFIDDNDGDDDRKLTATIESNEICPSVGYFVHPDDCSEYYQCIQSSDGFFSVIQFECPSGTIWDSRRTTCNPLEDVGKTQGCRHLLSGDNE